MRRPVADRSSVDERNVGPDASRIANPDRVALRKESDPEGYRADTLVVDLFQPPVAEVFHIDTTSIAPADNARLILEELHRRGFVSLVAGDAL